MTINMKRFATVIGVSAGLLAAGIANASLDFDQAKFYVGAEAGYTSFGKSKTLKDDEKIYSYNTKKSTPSATILAGVRVDNFGLEFGATKFKAQKAKNTINGKTINKLKTKASNMYLDLMGYMPLESNIELVGAIGIGKLKADQYDDGKKITNTVKDSSGNSAKSSSTSFRGRIGAQYNFNENLAARAMLTYQQGNKKALFKSATTASLGVVYTI